MKDWLQTRIELPSWAKIKIPPWRSFRPPYSFSASLSLAVTLGLISPVLLRVADYKRFAHMDLYRCQSYPWLFFLSLGIIVALLYWATDRKQFRWDAAGSVQLVLVLVLFAFCVTASVYCCAYPHLCMGGHMEHPPYATSEYVGDAIWAGGLILGVALLARVRSPATAIAAVLCGFHLSFRFAFGSFGGIYPLPF